LEIYIASLVPTRNLLGRAPSSAMALEELLKRLGESRHLLYLWLNGKRISGILLPCFHANFHYCACPKYLIPLIDTGLLLNYIIIPGCMHNRSGSPLQVEGPTTEKAQCYLT